MPKRNILCASLFAALLTFSTVAIIHAQNSQPPSSSAQAAPPASSQTPATGATVSPSESSHGTHTVTVTFDYDFGKTPACSAKVTKGCVQQFIAFDISGGTKNPPILFPIPLPANPVGSVRGISRTSPPLDFESGKHLISVAAMSPDGSHSQQSVCSTWITIP